MPTASLKSRMVWGLFVASVALLGFHLYAFWVLASTFAAGLVWWASLLVFLGPPVALACLVCSLRQPRQPSALAVSSLILVVYVILWAPLVPRMNIKLGG